MGDVVEGVESEERSGGWEIVVSGGFVDVGLGVRASVLLVGASCERMEMTKLHTSVSSHSGSMIPNHPP
jgi:hypothetical protein